MYVYKTRVKTAHQIVETIQLLGAPYRTPIFRGFIPAGHQMFQPDTTGDFHSPLSDLPSNLWTSRMQLFVLYKFGTLHLASMFFQGQPWHRWVHMSHFETSLQISGTKYFQARCPSRLTAKSVKSLKKQYLMNLYCYLQLLFNLPIFWKLHPVWFFGSLKEEPLGIAGSRFLQTGRSYCCPSNNVKAL